MSRERTHQFKSLLQDNDQSFYSRATITRLNIRPSSLYLLVDTQPSATHWRRPNSFKLDRALYILSHARIEVPASFTQMSFLCIGMMSLYNGQRPSVATLFYLRFRNDDFITSVNSLLSYITQV